MVGHYSLVRTGVTVGAGSQLAAHLSIERGVRIGSNCRLSPLSHLTGEMTIGDSVFIGGGVVTVNDRVMEWRRDRPAEGGPELRPPTVETYARIGSGVLLGYGVTIGEGSFVASGAVVVRDTEPGMLYMGVPARRVGQAPRRSEQEE